MNFNLNEISFLSVAFFLGFMLKIQMYIFIYLGIY